MARRKVTTHQMDFERFLTAWARKQKDRHEAIFKTAAQKLVNEVRRPLAQGGNMPVDTGNLRRSLLGSTSHMPKLRPLRRKSKVSKVLSFPDDPTEPTITINLGDRFDADPMGQITLVIARMKMGQTLYLGFQASYAAIQEEKRGFVRLAAQRWRAIVKEASREVQARTKA